MDANYVSEERHTGDKDDNIHKEEQDFSNPIHSGNLTRHLDSGNDSRCNYRMSPRRKSRSKRPMAYGDSAGQSPTENISRFERSPQTQNFRSSDFNPNRSLPTPLSTPAPVPARMCVSLSPASLKFLRDRCKDYEPQPTPAVSALPFSKARKDFTSQEITPQVSLTLKSIAETPLRRSSGISNIAQASSEEMAIPTADGEIEITYQRTVDQSAPSIWFESALSVFPVEDRPCVPGASCSVMSEQSTWHRPSVIVCPSTDEQLPALVYDDDVPQSQRSWLDDDPDPPVLTIMPGYQEEERVGGDSPPPSLSPILDYHDEMEVQITRDSVIRTESRLGSVQGEVVRNEREANSGVEYYYADAQPSTSGLPYSVTNDMDISDSDDDDREEPFRINLYPPLYKSPSKRKISTKGSSKYKAARDKPRNNKPVNYGGENQLLSPDIDPHQVPGFVSINGHGLRFGPSNVTLTRELIRFRDIAPSFSSFVVLHMYVLFNGFISNADIRHYADNICSSAAFYDTTDLEVECRSDTLIRFAVCQVCGVPRYIRRVGKWQVWAPIEDRVCRHPEPHYFAADFQHVWWNLAHQSGLVPINPSLFPFCLLFARLGDLAELTLAALVVSGVFPILNRKDIPSEWPLGRQAYVETDDQLQRSATYAFVKWVRDNEQVGTGASFRLCRSPRRCPLCGGRINDVRLHYGIKQPLVCKDVVNFARHVGLANRVRLLVQQHRPIIWAGRPSVQALLYALSNATVIQINAAAILFCIIGAVLLTHEEHYPALLNLGPFISARSK